MSNKPFSWIARQPYSIRYGKSKVVSDNEPETQDFLNDMPLSEDVEFERGVLWPTFVLVENLWSSNPEDTDVFIRIFRKDENIVVDIWKGHDMKIASSLAKKYNIPIYSISTTRNGKRSVVHRINPDVD
ncbi:MAG: hypothetical protein ACFFC7_28835 [Candidatus Hermodarchaeota archaeon]